MKILYINHYAGSLKHGMEFRPFYLAREWGRLGHSVEIVAASFSHVRRQQPTMSGSFTEETIDNVRYKWCKTPAYEGNGISRVINMFVFLWRLFQMRSRWQGIDAVIASSTYPLDIFPAWWIARRNGARLIFEVHDLWPLSPIELGGMSKWHPFIVLLQLAEDFAYRVSNVVVSMLPLALEHMVSRGMDSKKFVHIPNGIDLQEWLEPQAHANKIPKDILEQVRADQKANIFTIGYVGAHGIANALDRLIDAARMLQDMPFSFYLIGPGPEKANLKKYAGDLPNVHFFESVSKLAVPALLLEFDVLYIGLQRQSLFRFGISPNKLMDYMAAGRPIVNAISSGNDPVSDSNCGITIKSEDPGEIAATFEKLQKMPSQDRMEFGRRGQVYVWENHSYAHLAQQFLDVM